MIHQKNDPRAVATATRVKVQAGRPDRDNYTRPCGVVHDALTFACGWGWPVLPVRPGTKLPATRHGLHDATTDPDRVLEWWNETDYNIGIATGEAAGLVVLDVDPGGTATLADLTRKHGPLPRTVQVHTPRGGFHAYFAHPGIRVPNSVGKLGMAVDVRGDGGYVLAPPSVVDGRRYCWQEDPWPGPPDLPVLPDRWVELITGEIEPPTPAGNIPPDVSAGVSGRLALYVETAVQGELTEVAAAVEGTRNHRLNAAAFRLGSLAAAGAVDVDAAREALAVAAGMAGLGAREAERTIASGIAAGLAQPAELPREVAA